MQKTKAYMNMRGDNMNKRIIYIIGGALILIGLALILVIGLSKKDNKESNEPQTETEKLETEKQDIEDKLADIEKEREKVATQVNELSEKRAKIMKDHPDWDEIQIRGSQEYKDLTAKIKELEKKLSEFDESKNPYYEREIEIQDEMTALESEN